jgi:hypothetical protein
MLTLFGLAHGGNWLYHKRSSLLSRSVKMILLEVSINLVLDEYTSS